MLPALRSAKQLESTSLPLHAAARNCVVLPLRCGGLCTAHLCGVACVLRGSLCCDANQPASTPMHQYMAAQMPTSQSVCRPCRPSWVARWSPQPRSSHCMTPWPPTWWVRAHTCPVLELQLWEKQDRKIFFMDVFLCPRESGSRKPARCCICGHNVYSASKLQHAD